jgi:hypothetical protein
MIHLVGGKKVATEAPEMLVSSNPANETKTESRGERIRRWLIVIATVILAVFLVYLLLVMIYPSLNIGMNP